MLQMFKVYILGPMTGIVNYNFPAFDAEASDLRTNYGYEVVSPTDLNRAIGFDPKNLPEGYSDWHKSPPGFEDVNWIAQGIKAAMDCNAYVALTGWENSKGARAEKNALDVIGAKWLNEPVKNTNLVTESICEEAQRLTTSDRQGAYGHPLDNFTRLADLINARFGTMFVAEDIPDIMILMKIARNANAWKRDNFVDAAGYANTWGMVVEERQRRKALKKE